MEEKPRIYCICCGKILKQTVCLVENAGFVNVVYPMMSDHYGKTMHGYVCDECTQKCIDDGRLNVIK